MEKNTISNKIKEYIMELIEKNYAIPEYKLPSESALARKFNVSIIPVRKAYASLKERGYVTSWQGKGYFITRGYENKTHHVFKNICFITPSIKAHLMREIITGIQSFCEKHMLNLSIMITDQNVKKEKRFLQSIPQSNVKGIIIFPVDNEFYNEDLLKLAMIRFPIVIIDRNLKGVNLPYIATDNYQAMIDAVSFLHKKKHKNIVFVTPPPSLATSIEEEIAGYRHAINKYYKKVKNEAFLEIKPDDMVAIEKSLIKYLKEYPDTEVAIVAGAQVTAALKAAKFLKIPVPEKLKLMVISNELSDTEKATTQPYIIEIDGYEMGYRAGAALYNQIYGDLRIITEKLPIKIIDCSKN